MGEQPQAPRVTVLSHQQLHRTDARRNTVFADVDENGLDHVAVETGWGEIVAIHRLGIKKRYETHQSVDERLHAFRIRLHDHHREIRSVVNKCVARGKLPIIATAEAHFYDTVGCALEGLVREEPSPHGAHMHPFAVP